MGEPNAHPFYIKTISLAQSQAPFMDHVINMLLHYPVLDSIYFALRRRARSTHDYDHEIRYVSDGGERGAQRTFKTSSLSTRRSRRSMAQRENWFTFGAEPDEACAPSLAFTADMISQTRRYLHNCFSWRLLHSGASP